MVRRCRGEYQRRRLTSHGETNLKRSVAASSLSDVTQKAAKHNDKTSTAFISEQLPLVRLPPTMAATMFPQSNHNTEIMTGLMCRNCFVPGLLWNHFHWYKKKKNMHREETPSSSSFISLKLNRIWRSLHFPNVFEDLCCLTVWMS